MVDTYMGQQKDLWYG